MGGRRSEWTVRPGWGIGAGVGASGTVGEYIVESHSDSFRVYFAGVGAGLQIGVKAFSDKMKGWSGAGALESMPSLGSPLHISKHSQLARSPEGHWMLSGTGAIIEGGGGAGIGAGMQLLLFKYRDFANPGSLIQAGMECFAASYGAEMTFTQFDAFAIVGGVSVGPQLSIGATAYGGVFA